MRSKYVDPHLDSVPTKALAKKALSSKLGGNVYWDCVKELRRRGTREVFLVAKRSCLAPDVHSRCFGIDVLSQLRRVDSAPRKKKALFDTKPVFVESSIRLIRPKLKDRRTDVLTSAIYALGHRDDSGRAKLFLPFLKHRNRDVRYAVATALGGDGSALALTILIKLTADTDPATRDWATFGLGTLSDEDNPQIREALASRLRDRCKDARYEAIVGLAKRKDARAIEPILHDLKGKNPRVFTLDAAREFAHPVFLPLLRRQWTSARKERLTDSYWGKELKEAIAACRRQI